MPQPVLGLQHLFFVMKHPSVFPTLTLFVEKQTGLLLYCTLFVVLYPADNGSPHHYFIGFLNLIFI